MSKKFKKMSRKIFKKRFYDDKNSQVIVLAGVVMFISIIFISSLAPELANISRGISSEKSGSALQEFLSVKKMIPYALTFNLAENITIENNDFMYYGNISNLTQEFNILKNNLRTMEFKHNVDFDLTLNDYWIAHPGSIENIYYLNLTMSLRDNNERHSEDVCISFVCNPLKS